MCPLFLCFAITLSDLSSVPIILTGTFLDEFETKQQLNCPLSWRMFLRYVWNKNRLCQSFHNHGIVSLKVTVSWQLRNSRSQQMFQVFASSFDTLKWSHHWWIAWSVKLSAFPSMFQSDSVLAHRYASLKKTHCVSVVQLAISRLWCTGLVFMGSAESK